MKNVNCYFDDCGILLKDIIYEILDVIITSGDRDDI